MFLISNIEIDIDTIDDTVYGIDIGIDDTFTAVFFLYSDIEILLNC